MGNYMTIKCPDIANGPGCRLSIFLSGCDKRCPGCFNEAAWDYTAGQAYTKEVRSSIIRQLCQPQITGLTILGGEPMDDRNLQSTLQSLWAADIAERLIASSGDLRSRKNIERAVYTGYTFEELMGRMNTGPLLYAQTIRWILSETDVLVDGPFIQEEKDISLHFRGSSNQRILNSRESLKAGKAIWTTRREWLGEF